MGRIYEQLKQNIDFLNEIDRRLQNDELLNMHEIWEVQKAVLNIKYVIDYTETSLSDAIDEGRFEAGDNGSFNIPEDFEQMVNQWEDQFDEEQVDQVLEHLQTNQRVPSYSPEINEPDPIRYFEYVTGTLDTIVPTVAQGHFGPTAEAFKRLTKSARQDYINTALEQNFVMERDGRITRDVYPWLTSPHERYMGDVGVEDPMDYVWRAQREIDNYEREEDLEPYQERFKNNLPLARAVAKVENANNNPHALADAIKEGVEKNLVGGRNRKEASLGEILSKTRAKLEEKVLFGELDLSDENEDCQFLREYLADPVEGMAKFFERQAASQGEYRAADFRQSARKMRAERNSYNQANRDVHNGWDVLENNRRDAFEMYIREDFPDFDPTQLANEYKGGFIERNILRSTSQEWKDVEAAFASWDRNGPEKGNLAKVSSPAMAYLRHKFPHTKVEDITPEMARSLRGAGARRAEFCLSVVDAAARAGQDAIEGQREANDAKIREFEKRAGIVHEEPVDNNIINNDIQNELHESLKNDIEAEDNEIEQAPNAGKEERHNENEIILGEDE